MFYGAALSSCLILLKVWLTRLNLDARNFFVAYVGSETYYECMAIEGTDQF